MFDIISGAINVQYFIDSLPTMGKGMLGIFIVTTVVVTVVNALNSIPEKKEKKRKK